MSEHASGSIEDLLGPGGWAPLRRHFGVSSFGINAWRGEEAGETIIPEHEEVRSGHEELYVVLTGRATFTVDGDETDAPPGTVVFVRDPSLKRAATAAEPATTILSVGAKPGEPYQPMPWEDNQDAIHLFGVGDHAGAKQVMLDALERRPGEAVFLYNLACAEALLGEREEAIEHLVTAAAREARFADAAQTDDDLASLRDDPRFPAPN
jgi:hypothetical protein